MSVSATCSEQVTRRSLTFGTYVDRIEKCGRPAVFSVWLGGQWVGSYCKRPRHSEAGRQFAADVGGEIHENG